MRAARALALVAALCLIEPVLASETVTYTYDALGRVTGVAHAGTVNAGLNKGYTYDAADNRSNVTVAGSSWAGSTRVAVIPLRGLSVIVVAPPVN